ncbi:DMT family transporter [Tabrizicola sp.]|uniref:DMT family transporter n=1 Tax=Tabrizicola sp. TaxID=2005166 RepID=UPI001A5F6ABC|nr:DMT family transporter [Tabrizicola sp.]MBL9062782.1 DMT family transporter [Tabrizicola sp.]
MSYKTGAALVLVAGVLWSFQGLIIRQLEEAGSWTVLFWRSVGMVPTLYAFLILRGGKGSLASIQSAGATGIVAGIGLVVAMAGAIVAFQLTTVANAAFLFAASPFFAAILGRAFLGEAVAPRTWLAIGLALIGIFIMVSDSLSSGAWLGNVAALSAAFGFAGFTVCLRWRRIDDSLPFSILGALFSVIISSVAAGFAGQSILAPASDILWCLFMGVVTMAGGMILYTYGSRTVPSAELALLSNIEVMLAPVWVWIILSETGSDATLIGGAVLLSAILFNAYSGARRAVLS